LPCLASDIFFKLANNLQQIPSKQYSNVQQFILQILTSHYLLQIVGEFKKNVTRQTWQALFHFGEYLFQSTRHFGECLKNMVSHTVKSPDMSEMFL
jgi:hypothetical protein